MPKTQVDADLYKEAIIAIGHRDCDRVLEEFKTEVMVDLLDEKFPGFRSRLVGRLELKLREAIKKAT